MAHELEIDRHGAASFCYNHKNGNPWHQLGTPFSGGFTLAEGLQAARVRIATTEPLYAMTPGGMVEVEDQRAVVWPSIIEDGMYDVLGVVSNQYQLVQYHAVAELAMAIVGAADTDAVLDTMGLLFEGKRFFGFIDFGALELVLPNGAIDRFTRGLGFMSSHDGSQSITFANGNMRWVCNNTVTGGLATAKAVMRVRHTTNADSRLSTVRQALELQYGGDAAFTQIVQDMGMVDGDHDLLDRVINKIWPKPKLVPGVDPKRAETISANRKEKIHALYDGPSCAGGFGNNGWSVFNAITEHLDHQVGNDSERRARNAIDPSSGSAARKNLAAELILSS